MCSCPTDEPHFSSWDNPAAHAATLCSDSGNCYSLQRTRFDYFPVPVHSAAKQTIVLGELAETRWLTSPLLLLHDMDFLLFPSTHPSISIYCCVWSGREPFLFISVAIWQPWGLVPAWNSFNSCINSSSWENSSKGYWKSNGLEGWMWPWDCYDWLKGEFSSCATTA